MKMVTSNFYKSCHLCLPLVLNVLSSSICLAIAPMSFIHSVAYIFLIAVVYFASLPPAKGNVRTYQVFPFWLTPLIIPFLFRLVRRWLFFWKPAVCSLLAQLMTVCCWSAINGHLRCTMCPSVFCMQINWVYPLPSQRKVLKRNGHTWQTATSIKSAIQ